MMKKELIKTIIVDNQLKKFDDVWERKQKIPINTGKVVTLMGVRRSGKTYQLYSVINQLRREGISSENIIYFNFEDERLNLAVNEMDLIIESFRELYPKKDLSKCYFLFDEVQEVSQWEKFVNRIYASISKNIFITGSNANLLSREIATTLRGRTITFEVYPLSFSEYVKILAPKISLVSSQGRAEMIGLFDKFMYGGGFPEVISQSDSLREKILQEYFNVMLLKDLIDRYKINDTAILKYFCKRVVACSGGEFSVNKIFNEIKSQGYKVSKNSLYNYQDYCETIYLNRFVNKFSTSIIKSENSFKKSYVIDTGLGVGLDYKLAQDKGRLLENVVCLELFKQGLEIAYLKNGFECDFVVIQKGVVTQAIQVCLDVSDKETEKREIKGLVEACMRFNLKEGYILTYNEGNKLMLDGISINIVPVWKYFM